MIREKARARFVFVVRLAYQSLSQAVGGVRACTCNSEARALVGLGAPAHVVAPECAGQVPRRDGRAADET